MNLPVLDPEEISRIVDAALREDLRDVGDVTSEAVIDPLRRSRARIVAREDLSLAGLEVAREVFRQVDPALVFDPHARDGERVERGRTVAFVEGTTRRILEGERTALNFLMRMCGVANATRAAMAEIEGTGAVVLDTRKTMPGLRALDKYSVACGGGANHRMGLWDAVMIKDTHLDTGTSIAEGVRRALARGHAPERITVEVRDRDELEQALASGCGRVLLDNMPPDALREAVALAAGRVVLEASGGMRPGRLRAVAETGVDCLSMGWLTHSSPAADLAMEAAR